MEEREKEDQVMEQGRCRVVVMDLHGMPKEVKRRW